MAFPNSTALLGQFIVLVQPKLKISSIHVHHVLLVSCFYGFYTLKWKKNETLVYEFNSHLTGFFKYYTILNYKAFLLQTLCFWTFIIWPRKPGVKIFRCCIKSDYFQMPFALFFHLFIGTTWHCHFFRINLSQFWPRCDYLTYLLEVN